MGCVLMHRLALGAFWHGQRGRLNADGRAGLNAPFGARCFLTQESRPGEPPPIPGLNAPFGARCFLTTGTWRSPTVSFASQCTFWRSVLSDLAVQGHVREHVAGLNASYGARCFLTVDDQRFKKYILRRVLMRLLALGAF